jgi:hypothetical protein
VTRRTLKRLSGALTAVVALVGMGLAVRGYQRLCSAPLDTYPILAASRAGAVAEAGGSWSATSIVAGGRAVVLDAVLQVKQSDLVAFPSHVVAGVALEYGGCAPSATRDQWRKAAVHAWSEWAAGLAAAQLGRTAQTPAERLTVLDELAVYASDEPWHAANLRRVAAALIGTATDAARRDQALAQP